MSEMDFDGDGIVNILDSHYSCFSGTYHDIFAQESCTDTETGYYFDRSDTSALIVGNYVVCTFMEDGSLYCWGENNYGQVGDGTATERHTPVEVTLPVGRTVSQGDGGETHTCAVMDDGSLYCWGTIVTGRSETQERRKETFPRKWVGRHGPLERRLLRFPLAIITPAL